MSPEPLRFEEAMDSDESIDWKKATDDEMKCINRLMCTNLYNDRRYEGDKSPAVGGYTSERLVRMGA